MNITQYRELKAQEATQTATPVVETPVTTPVEKQIETPVTPVVEVPATPEKHLIDGVEVSLDELKSGYLRQKDYTQKTQDIAKQRGEVSDAIALYENLKQNPQLVNQIKQATPVPAQLDPATSRVVDLETKLYDMMLHNEIAGLQNKYPDFEVREVLQTAQKKGISNLEDAYHLSKSNKPSQSVDVETQKAEMRKQILEDLKKEGLATQSMISSNDGATQISNDAPLMSEDEKKVARMMRLSDADYAKWRDVDKVKKK